MGVFPMTAASIAAALNGKPSGTGFLAHCPAHDDKNPSLSISDSVGKVLLKCHAGCSQSAVIEALKERGIWVENGNGRRELARFDYRDASGKVLYQIVRFEPKDFRQFNPASGAWSTKGLERVPYRLPEILAAIAAGRTIWICEGEKDVESLRRLGFDATCNGGGCGSAQVWRDFAKRYFPAGTKIVLCPDSDEPGRKLMTEVASYVAAGGCQVQEARLGYPIAKNHGKDISDWIAERKTHVLSPNVFPEGDESETIRDSLQKLVAAFEPEAQAAAAQENHRGIRFIRASDIELTKPEYIDPDRRFEKDTIASIFGDPGSGKTFYAIRTACEIAALGGTVFYIVAEGQRGFLRRLHAWCIEYGYSLADLPLYLSMAPTPMNDDVCVGQVVEAIRELAQSNGDPALVVLDTLARNLDGNENDAADMAAFLRGIERIRAAFRCTVMTLHHPGHLSKERSRGHSSWKGALDTEFRLDVDEAGIFRLVCTKSKDSIPAEPCAFSLKQIPIPGLVDDDGKDIFSAVLVPTEYEPARAPGRHGKWQSVGLQALQELQERYQVNLEADGRDPDTARVTLDDWRAECLAAGLPRRTFYKVSESLVSEKAISINQGFVCALRCAVPLYLHTKGTKGTPSDEGEGHKGHAKGTAKGTLRAHTETPVDTFDDSQEGKT